MAPESDAEEQAHLEALGTQFVTALGLKDEGKLDKAEEALRAIVRAEPRLAEPHLELARILLDTGRLSDAEDHAREGLSHLESTGVWVEEIPPAVVQALAHGLLAEVLRRRADEDDVIFGDPEVFRSMVASSKEHFEKAAALDPSDEYTSYYAFFMGVGDSGAEVLMPGEQPSGAEGSDTPPDPADEA